MIDFDDAEEDLPRGCQLKIAQEQRKFCVETFCNFIHKILKVYQTFT